MEPLVLLATNSCAEYNALIAAVVIGWIHSKHFVGQKFDRRIAEKNCSTSTTVADRCDDISELQFGIPLKLETVRLIKQRGVSYAQASKRLQVHPTQLRQLGEAACG